MRFLENRGPGTYGVYHTGAEGLLIAGIALTAISTGAAIDAQNKQAAYQGQVEDDNRKTSLVAAADAIHRGDIAEQAARTRTRLLIGEQQAGYAASGVELGSGTPANVAVDTAGLGELDALTIRSNATREAWGYLSQSTDFKRKGDLIRLAAKNSQVSTLLTGGSTALNQYSNAYRSGAFN